MKRIFVKSYNSDGSFNIIKDIEFTSFTKAINSGLQELNFRIARKMDEFNNDNEFDLNKKIELEVYDDDTGNAGLVLYSGYITEQTPIIDGAKEYVTIVCLGYYSKLSTDVLMSGSQTEIYTKATDGLTTTIGDIASALVSDVVSAILDYYNTNNTDSEIEVLTVQDGGEDSIEDTTNSMQVVFSAKTYQEAIDSCKNLASPNWFWYVGADNIFRFKQKPSTATHSFTVGKNIKTIQVEKNIQSVYNILLLWGHDSTGTDIAYKQYKDDVSISEYGRRVLRQSIYNVKDEATMNNLGASIIDENKDATIKITLEVIDNNGNDKGYDIESINPGDTCKIINLAEGDLFNSNMLITAVKWTENKATISVDFKTQNLEKYLTFLQSGIETQELQGIPVSYT